jgi:hypothetical protein
VHVCADVTTGEDPLGLGDGVGVVSTGASEALVVGTAVAVGLGCGLPDEHAARSTAVDAATIPNLTRWVMNNFRRVDGKMGSDGCIAVGRIYQAVPRAGSAASRYPAASNSGIKRATAATVSLLV